MESIQFAFSIVLHGGQGTMRGMLCKGLAVMQLAAARNKVGVWECGVVRGGSGAARRMGQNGKGANNCLHRTIMACRG